MDPAKILPIEIFEKIIFEIDCNCICNISFVSKQWREFVAGNDQLWKYHCRDYSEDDIKLGLELELSWEEIYYKYKEKYDLIQKWKKGYSKRISSNEDVLLSEFIGEFDVDTWGLLVDLANKRSSD